MIKNKIREAVQSARSKRLTVSAIVLGPDVWHELKQDLYEATGYLSWYVTSNPGEDPQMFGHRILVSNVEGEVSIL